MEAPPHNKMWQKGYIFRYFKEDTLLQTTATPMMGQCNVVPWIECMQQVSVNHKKGMNATSKALYLPHKRAHNYRHTHSHTNATFLLAQ